MYEKDHKLKIAPEYILEDENGCFFKCDICDVVVNMTSDLCNKCDREANVHLAN